jgi:AbrB family looped-hinge helix DNA binding protein
MYTTKISSQGTISLPAPLRKKYGFKIGETVIIEDNERITLAKPTDFEKLWEENGRLIKKSVPNKNGDGWTAHVLKKYGS